VVLAVAAPSAYAWGPIGHHAIGRVAEKHLRPEVARAVAELLAPEELAYVGTWADEIRSEPAWTRAEAWHWVTIPDGQTYDAAAKNPAGCDRRPRGLRPPHSAPPPSAEALSPSCPPG